MELDLSTPEGMLAYQKLIRGHVPDETGTPVPELEETLYQQIRIAGLPLPERQVAFHPERRYRADFLWEARRLIVEVQGGTWTGGAHVRGAGYRKDAERMCEAQLLGYRIFYVTSDMVEDGTALNYIEKALA